MLLFLLLFAMTALGQRSLTDFLPYSWLFFGLYVPCSGLFRGCLAFVYCSRVLLDQYVLFPIIFGHMFPVAGCGPTMFHDPRNPISEHQELLPDTRASSVLRQKEFSLRHPERFIDPCSGSHERYLVDLIRI